MNQREKQAFRKGVCLLSWHAARQIRSARLQESGHAAQRILGQADICIDEHEHRVTGELG